MTEARNLSGISLSASASLPGTAGGDALARVADMGMAAVVCTDDGTILAINPYARRILGPWAEVDEKIYHIASDREDAEALEHTWHASCLERVGWTQEFRVRGYDGTYLDLQLVSVPVWASAWERAGWLIIIHNLTESIIHMRELEIYAQELSQLHQANKRNIQQLEEAFRARDDFYALISHELRTPLTSLKAAIEMLGTMVSRNDREGVARIESILHRSTTRLELAINDLLDLATAQSGSLFLDFAPVNIVELAADAVDDVGPLASEKNIAMIGPGDSEDPIIVRGDEARLQQVLQNLLSNAKKATPMGGAVKVDVASRDRHAVIQVSNPGHLDDEFRAIIFEPFRKSPSGGYQTGAGLGLSVVDAMIRAHGGTVRVESENGKVTFTFTVPLWDKGGNDEGVDRRG